DPPRPGRDRGRHAPGEVWAVPCRPAGPTGRHRTAGAAPARPTAASGPVRGRRGPRARAGPRPAGSATRLSHRSGGRRLPASDARGRVEAAVEGRQFRRRLDGV
ncbi:MAG: hypothetical protein AVDCRST_MAG49-3178, partial [uncultured Thermomicrobiales bacterium]